MIPCSTCIPDELPDLINDQHGMVYICPRCKKIGGRPVGSDEAAIDDWNKANNHDLPAGCGDLAKGLMKWA